MTIILLDLVVCLTPCNADQMLIRSCMYKMLPFEFGSTLLQK